RRSGPTDRDVYDLPHGGSDVPHLPPAPLDPPRPDRLAPAVHIDPLGAVVPDPWAELGLAHGEQDPDRIRAAWRDAILNRPPEQEPAGARRAQEARDRLLDPERYLERVLGAIQVPDADAWGLPETPPDGGADLLDAEGRLAGQVALYALVEDALWNEGLERMSEEVRSRFDRW